MRKPFRLLAAVSATALAAMVCAGTTATATPPHAGHGPKFSAQVQRMAKIADPGQRALASTGANALEQAYNVKALWDKGIDGTGRTVTTVVSYGDKDIKSYIDSYDKQNGLPAADVQTIEPAGKVPSCDQAPDPSDCQSWGGETDLDVAMIHTMAPKAKIVIAATPTSETQGIDGFPDMMKAIDYLADNKATDVISMSLGTVEQDFDNAKQFTDLDAHFAKANDAGITVVASTGDDGASGVKKDGSYWPTKVATWPASEPSVTAVGGTVLHLSSSGTRTSPDSEIDFSGAGESSAYPVPAWQTDVAKSTGATHRTYPDISLEGIDGTSESSPLFGGVLALAAQSAGKPLGQINSALYTMGAQAKKSGIVDVTSGDNSYHSVKGYTAGTGFDINSGWGTLDASVFVPTLVTALK